MTYTARVLVITPEFSVILSKLFQVLYRACIQLASQHLAAEFPVYANTPKAARTRQHGLIKLQAAVKCDVYVQDRGGEQTVAKQLHQYLTENDLLPRHQSAYRRHHSTETAILRVPSHVLTAAECKTSDSVRSAGATVAASTSLGLRTHEHSSSMDYVVCHWQETAGGL